MAAWSSIEAIAGSSGVAKIAVSSAKVAVAVLSDVGRSLVLIGYTWCVQKVSNLIFSRVNQ
jgi:hypothetical protein